MTFDCQYSTNERLTYKFVTVFIVTENRNELVTINRLSLKPWGIALKFLFLHHENILFPND